MMLTTRRRELLWNGYLCPPPPELRALPDKEPVEPAPLRAELELELGDDDVPDGLLERSGAVLVRLELPRVERGEPLKEVGPALRLVATGAAELR